MIIAKRVEEEEARPVDRPDVHLLRDVVEDECCELMTGRRRRRMLAIHTTKLPPHRPAGL